MSYNTLIAVPGISRVAVLGWLAGAGRARVSDKYRRWARRDKWGGW